MTHWWRKDLNRMKYVAQEQFDIAMKGINARFDKTDARLDGAVATIRQDIRDLVKMIVDIRGEIRVLREDLTGVTQDLGVVKDDVRLVKSAVVETADTGQHLLNLTDELRKHGIPIEDSRVFKKS